MSNEEMTWGDIDRQIQVLPFSDVDFGLKRDEPIFVGVDFGGRSDSTAICIAQMAEDASIRILDVANNIQAITMEAMRPLMDRMLRKISRPKGYSQSHWRKIYRQSPRMRPVEIVYDRASTNGSKDTSA